MISDAPRLVYLPTAELPAPTELELRLGWPTKLCGGHLQTADPRFGGMAGVALELDETAAEDLGFELDDPGLSLEEVLDAATDEDRQVDDMWTRMFRVRWRRARGHRREGARSSEASPSLKARVRGRPSGSRPLPRTDGTSYAGREEEFRRAVGAQCAMELQRDYPAIDVAALRRIISRAAGREELPRAVPPAEPPRTDPLLEPCWLPRLGSISELVEWAFTLNLPPRIHWRDAVVQAVEFLAVRSDTPAEIGPVANVRPFALASLLVQDEIPHRRAASRFVRSAIEAELATMGHWVRKRASARLLRCARLHRATSRMSKRFCIGRTCN